MSDRYGFVYIWYDRRHRRFYIGCHWGFEGDGYICSSTWMRNSYKRRPQDFKGPKILKRVYTTRQDLLEEEYKWLSLIKDEELGKRYYNLSKKHCGHWTTDKRKSISIKEKIKQSREVFRTEEYRQKARENTIKQFENESNREKAKQITLQLWSDNENYRTNNLEKLKKSRIKARTALKEKWQDSEFKEKQSKMLREVASKASKGTIWFTNGLVNKRCIVCPGGFWKGMTK